MTGHHRTGARSRPGAGAVAQAAAREALAICAGADRVAEQASRAVGVDDERLFSLLAERERMLSGLARHIAALERRPSADGTLLATGERLVEDADALVAEVCEALSASQRTTMALAMRVADRVAELREELATVQRAGSAGLGYAEPGVSRQVDRIR